MNPPRQPDPELVRLLELAAEQLRCFPNAPIQSPPFDKSHDVAEFIEESTAQLQAGSLKAGSNLLLLFLPNSTWDDAGGSQDIANRLCELLAPHGTADDSNSSTLDFTHGDE